MGINKIDAGQTIRKYREAINDKGKIIMPGMNLSAINTEVSFIEELTSRGEGYQIKFNSYVEVQRYVRAIGTLEYFIKKLQKRQPGLLLYEDLDKALKTCQTKVYNGYVSSNYMMYAHNRIINVIKSLPRPMQDNTSYNFLKLIYDGKSEYTQYINSAISTTKKFMEKITRENEDKLPKLIKRLYLEMRPNFTTFNKDDHFAISVVISEARVMTAPKPEDTIKEEDINRLLMLTITSLVPALGTSGDEKKRKQTLEEAEAKAKAYEEMLAEKQPVDADQVSQEILNNMLPKFNQNPNTAINQLQQAEKLAEQLQEVTQKRNQILKT